MPNDDIFPKLRLQTPTGLGLTFPELQDTYLAHIHHVLVSSAFYAISDVLSLESIDPRSDVGSCLAIDVCSLERSGGR